ncbi:hypothetical protein [Paracoccus zhejiangensis]|uniref:hypothetical protein n=1 Tax=Paracoccus zhejiangensis TaxID=1077935 RepID=UPI0013000688|nr:hypothetical protein [Paracoccus zhejiangensis]
MAKNKNMTKKRLDEFLAALRSVGGSSGNGSLRANLNWDEEFYWKVQGHLIETGKVTAGRGRGGTVRISEAIAEEIEIKSDDETLAAEKNFEAVTERDLYAPLYEAIESRWINRFGLDEAVVAETHSRGSKETGGTYTRPDITAVGIRRYVYLPKRLEVVTFEVKPANNITIMGVLEAIAHREAAHRSYVVYAASADSFEGAIESERILQMAQKYGVGVVIVEDPGEVGTWDILVDAIRHEPDPVRLDRFLGDLPSDHMKKQLSKWKE